MFLLAVRRTNSVVRRTDLGICIRKVKLVKISSLFLLSFSPSFLPAQFSFHSHLSHSPICLVIFLLPVWSSFSPCILSVCPSFPSSAHSAAWSSLPPSPSLLCLAWQRRGGETIHSLLWLLLILCLSWPCFCDSFWLATATPSDPQTPLP